jgi:hypothetical protein
MSAMNSNTGNAGYLPGTGFLVGTGIVPQLVLILVLLAVLYITFFAAETLYKSYKQYNKSVVSILPNTYNSENKGYEFTQEPGKPNSLPLSLSDNERTGIEFSYSFYIFVNPSSFRPDTDSTVSKLLHVFHKGFATQFPLLGPGVYMAADSNTMRVYMNSSASWDNHIDISNFPVKKWVHIALVSRANGMEIYVNGDLSKRITFSGGSAYQNFQNIHVFSDVPALMPTTTDGITNTTNIRVDGVFRGMLSRLRYFNYAISYTEIASLVSEGPSDKVESQMMDQPPYLVDNWWTQTY